MVLKLWYLISVIVFCCKSCFAQVPLIDLDSVGGKLGFVGDYAGLSPYEKPRQFESLETDALLLATQHDSKTLFERLSNINGSVQTSCRLSDTQFILAGNFTSIHTTTFNYIAQFDTQTLEFSPLQQGLDGPVSSLLCINSSAVYVGGDFTAPLNTNASQYAGHVALWNNQQWTPLPWKGFNGPVHSITSNSESIIFGGQFDSTGDGLYANQNTTRPLNLATSATISSGNGANFGDYTNPSSVVCSQSSWLLQQGVPGYWQATFTSPLQPSVFRIKNAHVNGDNTNRFNIIALGSNTYFNLSYTDPLTKQTVSCSDQCFMSNDSSVEYQDFTVTDPMVAGGIRINIDTWYGSAGGLGGVSIFRSDVTLQPEITNSNSTINGNCYTDTTKGASVATTTGSWTQVFSYGSYQNFLTSSIPTSQLQTADASVTYKPYIASQGNYQVYITTPGCVGTSTCNQRTQAELTVEMTPGNMTTYYLNQDIVSDQQTLIYSGTVSASTSTFQPSVTMKIAPNATAPSGAQSVSLIGSSMAFMRNTTGGTLSSVMIYHTSNDTWSPLVQQLPAQAVVRTLQANNDMLYIGGLFDMNSTYSNLVAYSFSSNTLQPLANNGLNGNVNASLLVGSQLIVGGAFTDTSVPQQGANLQHVAIYDIGTNTWSGMDQGVNNNVDHLYTLDNNVIHLSGPFNSTGNTVLYNNAEWNLNDKRFETPTTFVLGPIYNQLELSQDTRLLFGNIKTAQTYQASNAIALSSDQTSSSISQADPNARVNAGVYWKGSSSDNSLILAGHFNLNNQEYPLVISHQGGWRGLLQGLQGEISTLSVVQNVLWIGGQFSGTVDTVSMTSFAAYDLENQVLLPTNGIFNASQQPGLVKVIAPSGDGKTIYVAGDFAFAGLLDCNSICRLTTETRQWNQLSQGLSGTINDVLINEDALLIAVGDLNVGQSKSGLASLDTTSSSASWTAASLDDQMIPTSIVHENDQTYIISGASQNNASPYLGAWNGQNFTLINSNLGPSSSIRQLLWAPISSASDASIARYPANSDTMLLAVGHLQVPEFGNSSAAFFDGTQWHPYLLTASASGSSGSIGRIFTAEPCCTSVSHHRHFLSVPAVILISIAISLGVLFLLIGCAFVVLFFKRRHTAVAAYNQDPMKEWKPKHRPSSLLAMLNAANLNGGGDAGPSFPAGAATTAAAAAAGGASRNNKNRDTMTSGYSTALDTHRGQSMDMGDASAAEAALVAARSDSTSKSRLRNSSGFSNSMTVPFSALLANALRTDNVEGAASEEAPKVYYSKFPFEAKEFGELAFDAHVPIVVTDASDDVWWMGYKDDGSGHPISGLFPSNYVSRVKPPTI